MSPAFSKAALTRFGQRADFGAIVGIVVVFAAFTMIDFHGWWSFFTMRNVTQYAAILGLVALGQTLVIIVGEIDLSVGSPSYWRSPSRPPSEPSTRSSVFNCASSR
jgi:ribose/xylose/arabinose/galactoside ABC-type transport system permease subunit